MESNVFKTIYINNEKTKYVINKYGNIINSKSQKNIKYGIDHNNGRKFATLSHKGKIHKKYLARWILIGFKALDESDYYKYDADHIDNNPYNDNLDNLQWLLKKDNLKKSYNPKLGENNNNAKLTTEKVIIIADKIIKGYTDKEISKMTGVSCDSIQKIKHKDVWGHVTKDYDFEKFINKREPYTYYTKELKNKIMDLLREDINIHPIIICEKLSLYKTRKIINLIYTLKRKIKKGKSSTTIESNDKYYTIDIH